jgi:hypothetical protein
MQGGRDFAADSACRTGDKRMLAGQIEHVVFP